MDVIWRKPVSTYAISACALVASVNSVKSLSDDGMLFHTDGPATENNAITGTNPYS